MSCRKNNIEWVSSARVLATVFILLCHVVKFYTIIPGHMELGQLFNVGVPMFIIISGYLYGLRWQSGGGIIGLIL